MPTIPINKVNFFIFNVDEKLTSVIVKFEHTDSLNLENLFLIIKTYVDEPTNILRNIYVIAKSESDIGGEVMSIFHSVSVPKIKKMNYIDFITWYEELYENDYEYLKGHKYYGIQFQFYKFSHFWLSKEIFPVYPWNNEYVNLIFKRTKFINEILSLKKEIIRLKKINYNLKYKRIRRKKIQA